MDGGTDDSVVVLTMDGVWEESVDGSVGVERLGVCEGAGGARYGDCAGDRCATYSASLAFSCGVLGAPGGTYAGAAWIVAGESKAELM